MSDNLRGMGLFFHVKSDGCFWFRLFGYGLHFKDVRKHSLLFSERNGYVRRVQIGNWSIKILKPGSI